MPSSVEVKFIVEDQGGGMPAFDTAAPSPSGGGAAGDPFSALMERALAQQAATATGPSPGGATTGRRMPDADWLYREVAEEAEKEADAEHERREQSPIPAFATGPTYGELLKRQEEEFRQALERPALATPPAAESPAAEEAKAPAAAPGLPRMIPPRARNSGLDAAAAQRAADAEAERLAAEKAWADEQERKKKEREAQASTPPVPAFAMPTETYGETLKRQEEERNRALKEDEARRAAQPPLPPPPKPPPLPPPPADDWLDRARKASRNEQEEQEAAVDEMNRKGPFRSLQNRIDRNIASGSFDNQERYDREKQAKAQADEYEAYKRRVDPNYGAGKSMSEAGGAMSALGVPGGGAMSSFGSAMAASNPAGMIFAALEGVKTVMDEFAKSIRKGTELLNEQHQAQMQMVAGDTSRAALTFASLAAKDPLYAASQIPGLENIRERIGPAGNMVSSIYQATGGSAFAEQAVQRARNWVEANEAIEQRGRQIAGFSPELAYSSAMSDVRKLMSDIREAQNNGGEMARLIDSQAKLNDEARQLIAPIRSRFIEGQARETEALAGLLEHIRGELRSGNETNNNLLVQILRALGLGQDAASSGRESDAERFFENALREPFPLAPGPQRTEDQAPLTPRALEAP